MTNPYTEQLLISVLAVCCWIIPIARRQFFPRNIPAVSISPPPHLVWFDILKGIAITAVVFIHTGYMFLLLSPHNDLYFINLTNNIVRFPIALFLITTGILLNPVIVTTRKGKILFYLKKLIRIGLPYTIVCIGYGILFPMPTHDLFFKYISGSLMLPYYYIIVLFQLYLLYPVLVYFSHKRFFIEVIFIISLTSYIFPPTRHFMNIPLAIPYMYYFAYGIRMRNRIFDNKTNSKKDLPIFYLIILTCVLTYITINEHHFNLNFFYGIAVFHTLYALRNYIITSKCARYIATIGKLSLWIYLLHFPIVYLSYGYLSRITNAYYGLFFTVFFCSCIASILLAYSAKKLYDQIVIKTSQ